MLSRKNYKGKLILLCGPSCVGKTPLVKLLFRLYPERAGNLQKLVLYNSRNPRPGEKEGIDYRYRTRSKIEQMRNKDNFLVLEARGDLHALDINNTLSVAAEANILFEGNTFIGSFLLDHPGLKVLDCLSIFISPLSKVEIKAMRSLPDFQTMISNMMKYKQIRRVQKLGQRLTQSRLDNIIRRANEAASELRQAWRFDYIIPNHDGEDSDNWLQFPQPVGDARKALFAFIDIIKGKHSEVAENWGKKLLL